MLAGDFLSKTMSTPSVPAPSSSENVVRRRRPATACFRCRDRRVKCDHARPTCFECRKRGRDCQYPNRTPPTVDFATEPLSGAVAVGLSTNPSPSSQTWTSVIKQQVDLVKKSNMKANSPGATVPFWLLAEVDEGTEERTLLQKPGIRVSALGEWFTSVLQPNLPPREICQRFFENFLIGIHPVIPVCHVPTLRKEYLVFWTNLSPETLVDSLVQILAVLYTGAATSPTISDVAHSSLLHSLYEGVLCAVDFDAYHVTSSSIQLLQGFLIVNTFRAGQVLPFSAFGFLPRAIRFAQSLRLHVDQKVGSPVELEVRRRLWWHLVSLDVESTIASGLQGIIRPDGYTTGLPSVICDDAISEDEGFPLLAGVAQPLSPSMVAMQGHWQWAQRMQTWFERMPDHDEVINFRRLIENLLSLISDCEENQWARTYLKMQIDRAYCMLGLRFWQVDQFKGTDCHSEVARTSRSFLQNYILLSELSETQGLCWFVPGFIQPIHALIIILMHMSACSQLDQERLLSQDLVKQVFSLRLGRILTDDNATTIAMMMDDEKNEISPKYNPRYRILCNLRHRVWKKFGWSWSLPGNTTVQRAPKVDAAMQETKEEAWPIATSEKPTQYSDETEDSTMMAALDDILLTGDPMDFFQWDEQESFAATFLKA